MTALLFKFSHLKTGKYSKWRQIMDNSSCRLSVLEVKQDARADTCNGSETANTRSGGGVSNLVCKHA